MSNYAEQISAFENKRAANLAAMEDIMAKAGEEGATLDAAQQEEFDNLNDDNEAIDGHLKRLRALETAAKETAKPVEKAATAEKGAEVRSGISVVQKKPEPGIQFARIARCKALAYLEHRSAEEVAKQYYPNDPIVQKGTIPAASTTVTAFAGALVGDETSVFADFVEYLRPQTILGKFGMNGVPPLRRVPFRTALISQSTGGNGYWVGEGQSIELTKFDFSRTTLEPLKVAAITAATEEVIRDSSPSAEMLLRDQLAAALRYRLDTDFINPDKTASAGASPAGITNGITLTDSSGRTAAKVRDDVRTVFNAFVTANNPPSSGVWIMSSQTALALSLMMNSLGQPEFSGITMAGGTFFGLPVITSEYVGNYASSPADYTNSYVYLANASDIYLADDGGVEVDMSREASLEMVDTGTQSSISPPGVTASQVVSLWQTDSVGFRAKRTINWSRRRTSAVAGLKKVQWGQGL